MAADPRKIYNVGAKPKTLLIRILKEWNEGQFRAMFLLMDSIHDYSDVSSGDRSNMDAYDWYLKQEIPGTLYDTFTEPEEAKKYIININQYTCLLLNKKPCTNDSKPPGTIERDLAKLLDASIPIRMGIPGHEIKKELTPSRLIYLDMTENEGFYNISLDNAVSILKLVNTDEKKKRFLKVLPLLRKIRILRHDDDLKLLNNPSNRTALEIFFKVLASGNISTNLATQPGGHFYPTNYDANSGFYKYLFGFKQVITPLNLLDSAKASRFSSAVEAIADYHPIPIGEKWELKSKFMMLDRFGDKPKDKFPPIHVCNTGGVNQELRIDALGKHDIYGFSYQTEGNVVNGKSRYESGPTLKYIATLLGLLSKFKGTIVSKPILQSFFNKAKESVKSNIYTLEGFIEPLKNMDKNYIARFFCDWKGFGDAEQTRFAADKLAGIVERLDNSNIYDPNPQPTKPLIMGTVDRNSWNAMRIAGVSCGYQGNGFYDFVFFPSKPLSIGSKVASELLALMSRITEIVSFVKQISNNGALDSLPVLLGNIEAALKNDNFDILKSIGLKPITEENSNAYFDTKVSPFINKLIQMKLKNAHNTFSEFKKFASGGIPALQGELAVYTPSEELIDKLCALDKQPVIDAIKVQFNGHNISVNQFIQYIREYLNSDNIVQVQQQCKDFIKLLPPTYVNKNSEIKGIHMFETQVFTGVLLNTGATSNAASDANPPQPQPQPNKPYYKPNNTINFHPATLAPIVKILLAVNGVFKTPAAVKKQMESEVFKDSMTEFFSKFHKRNKGGSDFSSDLQSDIGKYTDTLISAIVASSHSARAEYLNNRTDPLLAKNAFNTGVSTGTNTFLKTVGKNEILFEIPFVPTGGVVQAGGARDDNELLYGYGCSISAFINLACMLKEDILDKITTGLAGAGIHHSPLVGGVTQIAGLTLREGSSGVPTDLPSIVAPQNPSGSPDDGIDKKGLGEGSGSPVPDTKDITQPSTQPKNIKQETQRFINIHPELPIGETGSTTRKSPASGKSSTFGISPRSSVVPKPVDNRSQYLLGGGSCRKTFKQKKRSNLNKTYKNNR